MAKKVLENRIIYRLYDPMKKKYVSNIAPKGTYWKPKITYSNSNRSVIIMENDLNRFYKKVIEIKHIYKDVVSRCATMELDNTNKAHYDQCNNQVKNIEEFLETLSRLELQQFELIPDKDKEKLGNFKQKVNHKLFDYEVNRELSRLYGYNVTKLVIENGNDKDYKWPHAVVEFSFAQKKAGFQSQKDYIAYLHDLGISAKLFSPHGSQLYITSKEDYHLFCLTDYKDVICKKFIMEDVLKRYQTIKDEINNLCKEMW